MCTLGPGSVPCRQELGESNLLRMCQNWEERAEEQLTLKQEEGEAGQASEAPRRGRQSPQSFGVHRPRVGGGLQILPLPCAHHSPVEWTKGDYLAGGQCRVTQAHTPLGGGPEIMLGPILGVQFSSQFQGRLSE